MVATIRVEKDDDGYFEALVRSWLGIKRTPWKCDVIVITSSPWRPDAVTCRYDKDNPRTLHIDFYSALRRDFGSLSKEEAQAIIDQWM